MRRKRIIYAITLLMISYCTPLPINAQVQTKDGQGQESVDDGNRRRHIPRSKFTEAYKETFAADDFARRYRENFRTNSIFTSSADSTRPSIHSYSGHDSFDDDSFDDDSFDDDSFFRDDPFYRNNPFHDDSIEYPAKPKFIERGSRPLNVPKIPSSSVYSTGPSIDYYEFLRPVTLGPEIYAFLEERKAQQEEAGSAPKDTDKKQNAASADQPSQQAPKLRSPALLAYKDGIQALETFKSRKAVKIFENLTEVNPDNPKYQAALGIAYFFTGAYHNAHEMLNAIEDQEAANETLLPDRYDPFDYHVRKLERYLENNPNDTIAQQLHQIITLFD